MPSPPEWLKELADAAARLMMPIDLLSPIGCHFCCIDGTWEVSLFASNTQVVGGKLDGVLRASRFDLDLKAVLDLFSEVSRFSWQALALTRDDELGPHVSLDGTYAGNTVWLRILARPPKRFDPGRRAIVYEPAWEETW